MVEAGRSEVRSERAPLVMKVGFGAGDFAMNLFWTGTSLFLLYFYTDVLGLPPTFAGLVYFIAMVFDAVTDPLMGIAADRTRTRWGKFRPYLLFGALPLAAVYPLAYWAPDLAVLPLFWWTLMTHCLLRGFYTVVSIPYSSLSAQLSGDSNERATFAGWRMVGAASGGLLVALTTPILVPILGGGDERVGYPLVAGLLGLVSVAILWFCFAVMKERVGEAPAALQPASLRAELSAIGAMFSQNPPLIRVFLVWIISALALTMFSKNLLYFFKYDMQRPDIAAFALAIPAFIAIFAVPVWVLVSHRIGKRNAWLVGAVFAAIGYLAFYFNPVMAPAPVFACILLVSIGGSSFAVMQWAMMPDTVEYGEARTGLRNEAKVFGFASFAQKTAVGVNALLLGVLLDLIGYAANAEQTPETLDGIRAIMTMIPLAGVILGAIVLWRYPIDAAYHAKLRAEIAEARAKAQAVAP